MFGRSSAAISPNMMPVKVAQIDLLDAEGDPDLGQILLEELGRGLDVLVAGLDRKTSSVPSATPPGRVALGLVQIGCVLERLRIEARYQFGDAADGPLAIAPEDALDRVVVRERPAHRLPRLRAQARVGHGPQDVAAHAGDGAAQAAAVGELHAHVDRAGLRVAREQLPRRGRDLARRPAARAR